MTGDAPLGAAFCAGSCADRIPERFRALSQSLLRCSIEDSVMAPGYSAAARRSNSSGSAANTFCDISVNVRTSLGKSLFLVSVASSR